jgi:hypothetical protein
MNFSQAVLEALKGKTVKCGNGSAFRIVNGQLQVTFRGDKPETGFLECSDDDFRRYYLDQYLTSGQWEVYEPKLEPVASDICDRLTRLENALEALTDSLQD